MAIDYKQSVNEQLENYLKDYPIAKLNTSYDLRKLLEEIYLKVDFTNSVAMAEEVSHAYILNKYRNLLITQTKSKPFISQKNYLEQLRGLMIDELIETNLKDKEDVLLYPNKLATNALYMLNRDYIQQWYTSYKEQDKLLTAPDPRGLERIKRIENAYLEDVHNGNKKLGKGKIIFNLANGGCLMFASPNKEEMVVLYLVNSRKVSFEQKLPYEKEIKRELIGGSVNATTLKSIKETLRNFTNNSIEKEYWSDVLKIIETNI